MIASDFYVAFGSVRIADLLTQNTSPVLAELLIHPRAEIEGQFWAFVQIIRASCRTLPKNIRTGG